MSVRLNRIPKKGCGFWRAMQMDGIYLQGRCGAYPRNQ
jgi:hypothetical protein